MDNDQLAIDVEVQLDTNERVSGELADLLFNCGLEILRKDGGAIIVNQTDVVEVSGTVYVAIGMEINYVSELEMGLDMIDAIDEFEVLEETEVVLIKGDGVIVDEENVEKIRDNAVDVTSNVVSSTI